MSAKEKLGKFVAWINLHGYTDDSPFFGTSMGVKFTAGDLRDLNRALNPPPPTSDVPVCHVRFCYECGTNVTHPKAPLKP